MKLTNDYVLNIHSGSISRKIKRDFPEDYRKIASMDPLLSFKEKVYLYLNPTKNFKCKKCGTKTKVFRYSQGFTEHCSTKCRGRAPRNKINQLPTVKESDVTLWPLKTTLFNIVKNPNYSKAQIKREFFDFYCYLENNSTVKNFNEKLYLYLNNDHPKYCVVCGNNTIFDPGKFSYKQFCSKKCANNYNRKYLTGGYNHKYFEQYPKEKNKPAYFYFIELSDEVEKFLKIGITCREFTYRKNEICGKKYTARILEIKQMTLYECHLLETKLKENLDIRRYTPLKEISGKSECFNFNEKKNIWRLI